MSISNKHQSASSDRKDLGPKHHIYPNTSPPKRYYFGAPTPDMTPESSVAGDSVQASEARAPPALDFPLELSLSTSRESNHGSPTVSPSPSSDPSTSSSEALPSTTQPQSSASDSPHAKKGANSNHNKVLVFGPGHHLPFSIQEEVESEASSAMSSSSSYYTTLFEPRSVRQKKSRASSSNTVASQNGGRQHIGAKPTDPKDRSFKKRRSFRKRMRRIFGGGRDRFKGGDRIRF